MMAVPFYPIRQLGWEFPLLIQRAGESGTVAASPVDFIHKRNSNFMPAWAIVGNPFPGV